MASNPSAGAAGTLKRVPPPPSLATFRAPSSASNSTSSSSPSVPPPMSSAPTLMRPGILKPPSVLLGTEFGGPGSGGQGPVPDVASSSGGSSTSAASTLPSGGNGICAVPNCSANCGRPQSILKQQHGPHDMSNGSHQAEPAHQAGTQAGNHGNQAGAGFNSSCQQCIAERAAGVHTHTGVNTVSKATNSEVEQQQQQLDITSGLEFTSLHSNSDDGLDSLTAKGEETRGPRNKNPEPGRTYECEVWCRDASRQLAGCVGFTVLVLTYAALGAVLFMAIESRTAFKVNNNPTSNSEKDNSDPFLVEPPTVMNVTAAFMDMPKEVKANVEKARSETVAKLWRVTEQMNILYPENWTRIAAEEILWFQDQLTKAIMLELTTMTKSENSAKSKWRTQASQKYFYDHVQRPQEGPFVAQSGKWTFGRGFLYSVSLLTTVGCGTDWAVSPLSRLLTVLYLLVGLPIMYLYLTSTGSLMARLVCFLIRGLMCKSMTNNRSATNQNTNSRNSSKQCTPQHEHSAAMISRAGILYNDKRSTWQTRSSLAARSSSNLHSTANINTASSTIVNNLSRPNVAPPMAGCLLIITIYTLTGAAVISEAQSWHYNDALYYCFVSLFTIGFGGARPQDPNLWICAIYLLFGVTLMSTCGHILYQEVNLNMQVYRHVKRRNQILLTELESAKADIS